VFIVSGWRYKWLFSIISPSGLTDSSGKLPGVQLLTQESYRHEYLYPMAIERFRRGSNLMTPCANIK
jgi:hypothetical protein